MILTGFDFQTQEDSLRRRQPLSSMHLIWLSLHLRREREEGSEIQVCFAHDAPYSGLTIYRKTAGIEARMRQLEQLIQAIPPSVFAANGLVNPTATSSPQPSTVGIT